MKRSSHQRPTSNPAKVQPVSSGTRESIDFSIPQYVAPPPTASTSSSSAPLRHSTTHSTASRPSSSSKTTRVTTNNNNNAIHTTTRTGVVATSSLFDADTRSQLLVLSPETLAAVDRRYQWNEELARREAEIVSRRAVRDQQKQMELENLEEKLQVHCRRHHRAAVVVVTKGRRKEPLLTRQTVNPQQQQE